MIDAGPMSRPCDGCLDNDATVRVDDNCYCEDCDAADVEGDRTDADRQAFIDEDKGLSALQRTSRFGCGRPNPENGKRLWIGDNRAFVDEVMDNVASGRKPANYLMDGGTVTQALLDHRMITFGP